MSTVIDDLRRGTSGINNIETVLKELGMIGDSEQVPLEQFPNRIRSIAMAFVETLAPAFDKTLQYNIGDYVTHDLKLYKFKDVKPADVDWSPSLVDQITITDVLGVKIQVDGTKSKFSN